MTTLFSHLAPESPADPEGKSLLSQAKQSAAIGGGLIGGLFGGGSVLYMVFELMKSEPDKAFKLLQNWGPWCFLAFLAVWVLNGWITRSIEARAESDARMGNVLDRLATGQERIAAAAEARAAKDDRQTQQLEVLVSTVVVQSKRVLRKLHAQDRALERLEDKAGINRPPDDAGEQETDEQ